MSTAQAPRAVFCARTIGLLVLNLLLTLFPPLHLTVVAGDPAWALGYFIVSPLWLIGSFVCLYRWQQQRVAGE